MSEKYVKLNLGCGKTRLPNSIGVDSAQIPGYTDVLHNLDVTPYPFEDNSVDEIHMYHVIEHLHDPIKKMEELYRILKKGGKIHMRAPHFSSMGAFTDITHVRPFGYYTMDCFEPNSYQHFYTKAQFEVVHRRIKYLGLCGNTGEYALYIHADQCPIFIKPFVLALDFLINLSPMFFERVWCYWVGGATEVLYTLKKL